MCPTLPYAMLPYLPHGQDLLHRLGYAVAGPTLFVFTLGRTEARLDVIMTAAYPVVYLSQKPGILLLPY